MATGQGADEEPATDDGGAEDDGVAEGVGDPAEIDGLDFEGAGCGTGAELGRVDADVGGPLGVGVVVGEVCREDGVDDVGVVMTPT